MGTMSIRMPGELEKELKEFTKDEKLSQTSDAVRKLLSMGLEQWRKEKAFQYFIEGKCSMSKAAKMAQVPIWDFMKLVQERKIPWITDKDLLLKDFRIKA